MCQHPCTTRDKTTRRKDHVEREEEVELGHTFVQSLAASDDRIYQNIFIKSTSYIYLILSVVLVIMSVEA